MKNMLVIFLLLIAIDDFGQSDTEFGNLILAKKILATYGKLKRFENKNEIYHSGGYDDSIYKYNAILAGYISSSEFHHLKSTELKRITTQTEIAIERSQDSKLRIASWCALNPHPTPPMCTSIIVSNASKAGIICANGTGDMDFGDNVRVDSIFEIRQSGDTRYIVIGANKCGNLCMKEIAYAYKIINGDAIQCQNAFFDGVKYLDIIEFHYLINEDIKVEPTFSVRDGEIVSPIFNDDNTKQISSKSYKISF